MGFFDRIKTALNGPAVTEPIVRPGRNEPCWCGSGRKFKKCHLPHEEEKAAEKACSLTCGPS